MAIIRETGIAKSKPESDDPVHFYPTFGSLIPVLRGFRFTYQGTADREINSIGVLVPGQSQDLSPTAENSPVNVPEGVLFVSLKDADPGDARFSYDVSHSLLDFPGARRFQFRDVGCVGECVQTLPIPATGPASELFPPIVALAGFHLFFIGNREHDLDRVGVWFRGNDLHVVLRDKAANIDDTFGYLVDFVVIPTSFNVNASSGTQSGNSSGGEMVISIPAMSDTDFIITGWELDFASKDHEIRDLGVLRDGDNVTLVYADKNADDPFRWRVEWAQVGRTVAAPPNL